jgi:sialic acid synthase SpsE
MKIGDRQIGPGLPTYVIAEMSANHHQDFAQAVKIIEAAKEAGADAVKLQTYTPDTLTIDCNSNCFQIGKGTIWEGKNLYKLYGEAYTPWDWQPKLKKIANELGLDCFSTPFDTSAVEFLERMDAPAHKIASFEIVDIPLIQRVARTGKPIIMSTGMATVEEIEDAVRAAGGNKTQAAKLLGIPLRTFMTKVKRHGL